MLSRFKVTCGYSIAGQVDALWLWFFNDDFRLLPYIGRPTFADVSVFTNCFYFRQPVMVSVNRCSGSGIYEQLKRSYRRHRDQPTSVDRRATDEHYEFIARRRSYRHAGHPPALLTFTAGALV